ncbi:MAG: hypothetical protein JW798_07690 [Prolixibacteraceae bacterium]|nr:hypothetical protein [Prolixibacteraceae bacterium]
MKTKQIILLIIISVFSNCINAQRENHISVALNYVLIPHNIIQGAGYSLEYRKSFSENFSINGEFAYGQAMRKRENNVVINNYQMLPLHYNHAGYYLTVFPSYCFNLPSRLSFEIGAGISGCYQSYLYDTYHYRFISEDYNWDEDEQNGIYFNEGYFIGGLVKAKIKYPLSAKFGVFIHTDYKIFWQAENLFCAGAGISYSF